MEVNLSVYIELLKKGKIILYPTDTIWGIGCDATNEIACSTIMELKKRPESKSFVVLVDGFKMLEHYVPEFPDVCYDLVDLATEPLTIVYPSSRGLAKNVVADDGSVGIRITTDPTCLKLIQQFKRPIVSTSANISGEPFPTCFDEIDEKIKAGVDGIVQTRLTEVCTQPSKVIKIGKDSSVQILRG